VPPAQSGSKDLGRLLRTYRAEAGLSLRQVAAEAQLAPSTILRLERGATTYVRARHLQHIARSLRIDVEELYVAAGLLLHRNGLPDLRPYLRMKYDLPDEAIMQLDRHLQALRERSSDITREELRHGRSEESRSSRDA
jgi:transcriptional regulator with XRE-family HTH domain